MQANLHVCMHHTGKTINQPASNQEHMRIYKIQLAMESICYDGNSATSVADRHVDPVVVLRNSW